MKFTELIEIVPLNKSAIAKKLNITPGAIYHKIAADGIDRFTEDQKKLIIQEIKKYNLALEKFLKNPEI